MSGNNVDPSEYLRMTVAGATLHPPEKCSRKAIDRTNGWKIGKDGPLNPAAIR